LIGDAMSHNYKLVERGHSHETTVFETADLRDFVVRVKETFPHGLSLRIVAEAGFCIVLPDRSRLMGARANAWIDAQKLGKVG
jgi:hypothetical protein